MNGKKFSVIIATYTGEVHIADCFEAILNQVDISPLHEVIVVIDGPNTEIKKICSRYQREFKTKGVSFRIEQFEENKGRFEARYAGAKMATGERLLFIDDRTMMDSRYLLQASLVPEEVEAFISSIKESNQPNVVSKSLYYVRKAIYKGWGDDFEPHYITIENFESEAKGAAGMMVRRGLFIQACDQFKSETIDTENSSDDTKLLRIIVASTPIYKTSSLILYYEPRSGLFEELHHIYHRGPKFVDYYLKPSSRYFIPLVMFFTSVVVQIALFLINWQLGMLVIIAALFTLLALALLATRSISMWIPVFCGLLLTVLYFGAGLVVGLLRKAVKGV